MREKQPILNNVHALYTPGSVEWMEAAKYRDQKKPVFFSKAVLSFEAGRSRLRFGRRKTDIAQARQE